MVRLQFYHPEERSPLSVIPCTTVLSVSGFLALPALFPFRRRVFPGVILAPVYPRVLHNPELTPVHILLFRNNVPCATVLSVAGLWA